MDTETDRTEKFMYTVGDIYKFIEETAPFAWQEGYDNSGLCVGNMGRPADKIMLSLDCTIDVAREAVKKGVQLVVTHHPVIFRGIKQLDPDSVVGVLAAGGVSVISAHTNFDSAVMNDILCEKLGLTPSDCIAEEHGVKTGCICKTQGITAKAMAQILKEKLGCPTVRYDRANDGELKKIAVCSGSGGSFLNDVLAKGCDGFITGDVKHDIFVDAYNAGLTVFDAGHYYTENIFCGYMENALKEHFPDAEVNIAETSGDVVEWST